MARITADQRAKNKQLYDEVIERLFIDEGWKSVTYDRLIKELNLPRKSTLQNYYPSSAHFIEALRGKMFPIAASYLDFSSQDKFVHSWCEAMNEKRIFHDLIIMMISHSINGQDSNLSLTGYTRLIDNLEVYVGEKVAQETMEIVLGKTVSEFMIQKKAPRFQQDN